MTAPGYACAFGRAGDGPVRVAPDVRNVEVTFKCEDEEQGHPIGPAIIYEQTSSGPRTTESRSWVTIAEAKGIARRATRAVHRGLLRSVDAKRGSHGPVSRIDPGR